MISSVDNGPRQMYWLSREGTWPTNVCENCRYKSIASWRYNFVDTSCHGPLSVKDIISKVANYTNTINSKYHKLSQKYTIQKPNQLEISQVITKIHDTETKSTQNITSYHKNTRYRNSINSKYYTLSQTWLNDTKIKSTQTSQSITKTWDTHILLYISHLKKQPVLTQIYIHDAHITSSQKTKWDHSNMQYKMFPFNSTDHNFSHKTYTMHTSCLSHEITWYHKNTWCYKMAPFNSKVYKL